MFRKVVLLATSFGISLPSFGSGPAPDSSEVTVTVVMRFEDAFSRNSMEVMKRELDHIFHRSAVRLDWRFCPEPLGKEFANNLAVVDFKGKCRTEDVSSAGSRTLGITHILGGHVTPYAEVHCDQIQEVLHNAVGGEGFPQREILLGRALARVLAHELYHILTRTQKHGQSGITRRVLTPQDLVGNGLEFDRAELDEIQENTASSAGRTVLGAKQ